MNRLREWRQCCGYHGEYNERLLIAGVAARCIINASSIAEGFRDAFARGRRAGVLEYEPTSSQIFPLASPAVSETQVPRIAVKISETPYRKFHPPDAAVSYTGDCWISNYYYTFFRTNIHLVQILIKQQGQAFRRSKLTIRNPHRREWNNHYRLRSN